MYKTIRHGENSLQYTILPQNDDFRVEGKLTTASCSSSSCKPKPKRSVRRRSCFAYLGLLFVCTVIIGAVLIPFLVSAECLSKPSVWFSKTKAALVGSARKLGATSSSGKTTATTTYPSIYTTTDVKRNNTLIKSTFQLYPLKSSSIIAKQISDTQEKELLEAPLVSSETSNNKDAKTNNSESRLENDFVAEVRFEGSRSKIAAVVPTIVVTTVKNNDQNTAVIKEERVPPTLKTITILTMTITAKPNSQNITGRVMQVPLLKSASKKPIIPPVLAKTNSLIQESIKTFASKEEIEHQEETNNIPNETKDWIRSHWPYIDQANYFQWTGYKTEDSVLLPAILGAALIVAVMIVALFFIARNKRTFVSMVRKRNRNDIEEAGEDNTTLLTSSNLSDDD